MELIPDDPQGARGGGGGGGGFAADVAPYPLDDDGAANLRFDFEQQQEEQPSELPPLRPLDPKDPRRMLLTEEERCWALALKAAIKESPELDEISDFMCAQIAIVSEGDLERAMERAMQVQGLREELDIRETHEQGMRLIRGLSEGLPGHLLHFCYSAMEEKYSLVVDLTKTERSAYSSPCGIKKLAGGMYYIHHALCPDIESIRQGVIIALECDGYKMKSPSMIDVKLAKLSYQHLAAYPLPLHKMRYYHTGVLINTMVSLVRRCVPQDVHSKFEVGCQAEERLDSVLMFPNAQIATERMLGEMAQTLHQRYQNEKTFRLE